MIEGYKAAHAAKLSGCTLHQLRYWDEIGLVQPSVQATGSRPGKPRIYSLEDVIALKGIRGLLDAGLPLQRVGRVVLYLRKHSDLDQRVSTVIAAGGAALAPIGGDLIDVLREGQLSFWGVLAQTAGEEWPYLAELRAELVATVEEVRRAV